MTRLPVGEPTHTSIQEPDGSLEALAVATDPAAVAEVAAADRCGQFLHDLAPGPTPSRCRRARRAHGPRVPRPPLEQARGTRRR